MPNLQDADLFLVNREEKSYKISYEALKEELGGGSSPPVINSVVLREDDSKGNRFTSQGFTTTATMLDDGKPPSVKSIRSWVEGSLTSTITTDQIIKYDKEQDVWQPASSGINVLFRCIAYGDGKYVGIGDDGGTRKSIVSTDGINWDSYDYGVPNNFVDIAYGKGKFIAIALSIEDQQLMSSPDGETWTGINAPSAIQYRCITYSEELGRFVGLASGGEMSKQVIWSDDGISWGTARPADHTFWEDVVYGNGHFVAVNSRADQRVMISADGKSGWQSRNTPVAKKWMSIAFGKGSQDLPVTGRFVTVATDGACWSDDGSTWFEATIPAGKTGWVDVTYGNGLFVATSNSTSQGSDQSMYSTDGKTWTLSKTPEVNAWTCITFGGGKFVSLSADGSNRVMWSLAGGSLVDTLFLEGDKGLAALQAGDAIEQSDSAASGTVGSVNTSAKTIALATTTGTWSANTGKYVIGPSTSIDNSKKYLKLGSNLDVIGLTDDDSYTATPSNTLTPKIKFPATLDNGQAPDAALPEGTTIQTEFKAENTVGSDEKKSNKVTPQASCISGNIETDVITKVDTTTGPVYSTTCSSTLGDISPENFYGDFPDIFVGDCFSDSYRYFRGGARDFKTSATTTLNFVPPIPVTEKVEINTNTISQQAGGRILMNEVNKGSITGTYKATTDLGKPADGFLSKIHVEDGGQGHDIWCVKVDGKVLKDSEELQALTFKSDKDLAKLQPGDAVSQNDSAASGKAGAVDVSAKTMTLASSTGTWSANTGNYVIGPYYTCPARIFDDSVPEDVIAFNEIKDALEGYDPSRDQAQMAVLKKLRDLGLTPNDLMIAQNITPTDAARATAAEAAAAEAKPAKRTRKKT